MSEKYFTIGAPMTSLPRPVKSATYKEVESVLCTQIPSLPNSANYIPTGGRESAHSAATVRFHDCSLNASLTNLRDMAAGNNSVRVSSSSASALQICSISKDDIQNGGGVKEAKFSPGAQVSCPYLGCCMKNSQFQGVGRFPPEFLLNHLHSNHRHRRAHGDTLELTMVVPSIETEIKASPLAQAGQMATHHQNGSTANGHHQNGNANGHTTAGSTAQESGHSNCKGVNAMMKQSPGIGIGATQTWPFVEIYAFKRYFYLEAQLFSFDGQAELFLWLWFLGSESEELHYRYTLIACHGKSEFTYRGPVLSLQRSAQEVRSEGRCLVIRERLWDYMNYKLKITKH